ncbi:MAG: glycoside hydrolase family 2 TIM barrel-domain containing protein [Bacillota bacterium]|nr:glycoside hydrolase family 2 TIM barrel-domain containing protein [Bacillota bacterium]
MLGKIDLNGPWLLKPVEEFADSDRLPSISRSGWLTQELPAHWQQLPALSSYSGKVVYRKEFPLLKEQGMTYRLRLNGVFYWSTVYLNGTLLGSNEGYFIPAEYEVTGLLREQNVLVVEVNCPDEKSKRRKRMITGVFSHWDAIDPATNPGGIWLPVELVYTRDIYLAEKYFRTLDFDQKKARVQVHLVLKSRRPASAEIRLHWEPFNFKGQGYSFRQVVDLQRGENTIRTTLDLPEYRLWWTHDLGHPNLYRVTVEVREGDVLQDQESLNFGLRTFRMKNWICYLNGVRFLAKGNNYPPGDVRLATMTRERADQDLQLAKEAHMNMLRVHAHVDHPVLYEAADEAGILLWQDFPLQWQYRHDIVNEARRQVALMIKTLYNHPSIVIWCMHNEPIYMVDTKDETFWRALRTDFNAFVYSWDRDVLDRKLKKVAQALDPSRFVVRSSGEIALLHRGGDTHWYFGWYMTNGPKRRFELVRRRFPRNIRFLTEFGAQSFPNYESALRFLPADLKQLDWDLLAKRYCAQPDIMRYWLAIDEARSLQELIDLTQDYQIAIHQYYIDRLRFHKYRPTGGILAFMFQDANPAVTWSVVDYWRVPKRSYYHLQTAFNPEYVFTLLEKDVYAVGEPVAIPVYVVNDGRTAYPEVRVDFSLYRPDGERIQHCSLVSALEPDSLAKQVGDFHVRFLTPGRHRLELLLRYGERQLLNTYFIEVQEAEKE